MYRFHGKLAVKKLQVKSNKHRQFDHAIHATKKGGAPKSFVRGQVLARLGRPDGAQAEFAIAKKIVNADLSKRRESLGDRRIPNPELAQPPQ